LRAAVVRFLDVEHVAFGNRHPVALVAIEPVAAGGMKSRVGISGANQNIGVIGEH
jgi:hypothetical protein